MSLSIKPATWDGVIPFKWQQEVFKRIRGEYQQPEPDNSIVCAVTGSGKSRVIAEVCSKIKLKKNQVVAVTTDTVFLVDQIYQTINKLMPNKVSRYYTHEKTVRPITVICNKSLPMFLETLDDLRKELVLVNVDEAHLSEGKDFKAYLELLEVPLIGYTATAYRTKPNESLTLFKKTLYKYKFAEAIRDKTIVDWLIKNNKKAGIANDKVCLSMIKAEKGQGICNATDIKDVIKFAKFLKKNKVNAVALHSDLLKTEQREIIERFKAGKIKCLVHVNQLKGGVDFPFIKWLLLRRNIGSKIRFIQEIGRALRAYPNKGNAIFLDPHDLFGKYEITYAEALGDYVPTVQKFIKPLTFSEFEYIYDRETFKTVLAIENLIRNIQVKMGLYGVKIQRNKSHTIATKIGQQTLLAEISTFEVSDGPWVKFLDVVVKKSEDIRSTYCWCLVRVIRAIKILDFFPSFDDERQTITFTAQQIDKVNAMNTLGQTKYLTYKDKKQSLKAWSRETGISFTTLAWRYKEGWSPKQIIESRKLVDYKGRKFGAWTVIDKSNSIKVKVQCSCKKKTTRVFDRAILDNGETTSCGCQEVRDLGHLRSPELLKKLEKAGVPLRVKTVPEKCMALDCKKGIDSRGLCPKHYRALKQRGLLNLVAPKASFANFKDIALKIKPKIIKGICRLNQDGEDCKSRAEIRGVCKRHYDMVKRHKAIAVYAEASKKNVLTLNDKAAYNKCRVFVNGEPCDKLPHGRGICGGHYSVLWKKGKVDDFALPSTR